MFLDIIIGPIAILTCGIAALSILSGISKVRKHALFIALFATTLTFFSLLYARTIVEPTITASINAANAHEQVPTLCSSRQVDGTFCYQNLELRGFPAAVTVASNFGPQPYTNLAGRWGLGVLSDYAVYMLAGFVIANLYALGKSRYRRQPSPEL